MGFVEDEVNEVTKLCRNAIPKSKLVAALPSLVRVDIQQTESRQLTVCLRFPVEYPRQKLLLELKSKVMSEAFLERFTIICESKLTELLGKPQVMSLLKFIDTYLTENPLCVVVDEVQYLRKLLGAQGELKVKQKLSAVHLLAYGGEYYFRAKFFVPEGYPVERIQWETCESNLPIALERFVNGQAKEIARQCVEPPLRRVPSSKAFVPRSSLRPTLRFIIEVMKNFPDEVCPVCKSECLPRNAKEIVTLDDHDTFLIRMFCGHIYHQGCLKKYMSEPPFPVGGKKCPAPRRKTNTESQTAGCEVQPQTAKPPKEPSECGQRVTHDKWGLNDVKSAEAKWAHQQARVRELEEVIDFLQ